jgi:hypothetical protein
LSESGISLPAAGRVAVMNDLIVSARKFVTTKSTLP